MNPQWFTQAKENWLPPQEWTVIPFKNEDDHSFMKVTQVSSSKACKIEEIYLCGDTLLMLVGLDTSLHDYYLKDFLVQSSY